MEDTIIKCEPIDEDVSNNESQAFCETGKLTFDRVIVKSEKLDEFESSDAESLSNALDDHHANKEIISGCRLAPDNLFAVKEERQLDQDEWSDDCQKSLDNRPLKCVILPVKQENESGPLHGSENLVKESPLLNLEEIEESRCRLAPDNLFKVKEERKLLDQDEWSDDRQKRLENEPLKCIILPVKQENESGLWHDAENRSLENLVKEPPLLNPEEMEEWNAIFEHGSKPKLLTSHSHTSLHEKPDADEREACFKPNVKQSSYCCRERVLPLAESHNCETITFSNAIFEHGNKPKPLTSHHDTSLLETPDFDEREACFKSKIKQGSCCCSGIILPMAESHNCETRTISNAIFEHGSKPKPLTSHSHTSLHETPDVDEREACFKPNVKQSSCWCRERVLPIAESHNCEPRTFSSKPPLNQDERINFDLHLYKCEICSKVFTRKGSLKRHEHIHLHIKPYKCEICAKAFTQRITLTQHKQSHLDIKPFKCEICPKSFTRKATLKIHERIHSGIEPLKCEICSKTFTEKGALKKHEQIHSGIKPYKCEICAKAFTLKVNLDQHKRTHLGIKPYKCEICAKTFATKTSLNNHGRIHSGIKPHKCEICSKTFSRKEALKIHERMHSDIKPHKCEICSKTFTRKEASKIHERIHAGVKPYKCEICSKTFTRKEALTIHERKHAGVKPYKCEICSKPFAEKGALKKHEQIHSGCCDRST